jgi:SpoVK/Ycf46/Vps4 family AAA+-type ATPase
MKMWVRFPDWMKTMRARQRMSYLFVGPTGTGKTMHLKILARELMDFVEQLTGQRVSRLVMCDASSFYSPWFGQTEENITRWFERIHKLGATVLRGKDGREVRVPLLIVLEEAEALLRNRGEMGGSSHLFDRPLALMLQKLDSITDQLDIPLLFCSTTNRPDLIDVAARRRLGVSQVTFGSLDAAGALSVLSKKVPDDMPLRGTDRNANGEARQALFHQVLSYLFGDDPEQGVAEVRLVNADRRILRRRDLVTPAMIEQAISTAIDETIQQSADAGDLLGLDGAGIVRALHKQYQSLAGTLRPHNVREHCPEWFADQPVHVEGVVSLMRHSRLPRSLLAR